MLQIKHLTGIYNHKIMISYCNFCAIDVVLIIAALD